MSSAMVVRDAQDLVYREGMGPAVARIVWRTKGGKERPHYVVVDHYDWPSDTVRVTDVPRLPYRVQRDHFEEVWGGYALVTGRPAEEAIAGAALRRRALWAIDVALFLLAGVVGLLRRGRWKRSRGAALLSALGAVCLLLGCNGSAGDPGSAAAAGVLALLAGAVRPLPGRGVALHSPSVADAGEASLRAASEPVVLYFFDASCPDCRFVEEHLLERLLGCEGLDRDRLERLDVSCPFALDRLLAIERARGVDLPVLAPTVVVGDAVFCGLEAIQSAAERCPGAETPEGEGRMPCDAR